MALLWSSNWTVTVSLNSDDCISLFSCFNFFWCFWCSVVSLTAAPLLILCFSIPGPFTILLFLCVIKFHDYVSWHGFPFTYLVQDSPDSLNLRFVSVNILRGSHRCLLNDAPPYFLSSSPLLWSHCPIFSPYYPHHVTCPANSAPHPHPRLLTAFWKKFESVLQLIHSPFSIASHAYLIYQVFKFNYSIFYL